MYAELRDVTSRLRFAGDASLQYAFVHSVIRATLQHSTYALLETVVTYVPADACSDVEGLAQRMLSPSDGDMVDVLDRLILALRYEGWLSCAQRWTQPGGPKGSLKARAQAWVAHRNDTLGHGVVSERVVEQHLEALLDLADSLIEGLSDTLPRQTGGEAMPSLESPLGPVAVYTARLHTGLPHVLRRISRRGSVWSARAVVLSPHESPDFVIEIPDSSGIVSALTYRSRPNIVRTVYVGPARWQPDVLLPDRQTTAFTGRTTELEQLKEWYEDRDSRACLVYGEGGIGKTTLVLEFLNNILTEPHDRLAWMPHFICYFSAKQTRWGVDGLEIIGSGRAFLDEAVRTLVKMLEGRLDKTWYSMDSRALTDRAASVLSSYSIGRNDVLLVIDNAETLSGATTGEDEVGRQLKYIRSKIGRLIVTSRRRERVEAEQIEVQPFNEEEGMALLKRLAEGYEAKPFLQAGESRLKRVVKDLGGKPLLLDVAVRYVAKSASSIDVGIQQVMAQASRDLGKFLFDDAWVRMSERVRLVFLVLGQLGGTIDLQVVQWACGEVGIPYTEWLDSFEETKFGHLHYYGAYCDVELDAAARQYLPTKYADLSERARQDANRITERLRKRFVALIRAEDSQITDRVAPAFRTGAARAAKLAADQGNTADAIEWYEVAVREDAQNAALWDRFAWYLMVEHHLERAKQCVRQAMELDPQYCDGFFTAGMVAARQGDVVQADGYLDQAQRLGKPKHLCELQKARARIERVGLRPRAEAPALLMAAAEFLDLCIPPDRNDAMARRHMAEREKFRRKVSSMSRNFGVPLPRG